MLDRPSKRDVFFFSQLGSVRVCKNVILFDLSLSPRVRGVVECSERRASKG